MRILCILICVIKSEREVPIMKTARIFYFFFFALSALISTSMIYICFVHDFNHSLLICDAALLYVTLQIIGLIVVIKNRSRVLMGIFTIATGFATWLSASMAFASLGAPAPQFLSAVSLISLGASYILLVCYICLGIFFFAKRTYKSEQ